ncbi:tyrosine-protein phosphatase [Mixta tenebrionis]|mgnify:CR=1 FL=1|uniref:Tyrosine-protein phosphatase n=1 Tax=Mixta tenebrionis TaxID=2562439 RepID=A0A506VD91_9GAMM|nr:MULTISPECIES: tyrosine-protein phosphatase [Mixta]QHM76988.1 Tyrosine-protein phosphatase [Mixta theicola]TPW43605.1 tyrosine-protein phosphatase [Mixta tenebrionis]
MSREYGKAMTDILIPRVLELEGVNNVRDMGGYPVAGGHIRPGKLIRGEDLYCLTPAGEQLLAQIPLAKVVDLRTDGEVSDRPDRTPGDAALIRLDVLSSVLPVHSASPAEMLKQLGKNDPAVVFQDIYLAFVHQSACLDRWGEFLHELLTLAEGALYFHCTAGKDRTGFAAALVLMALGAERQVIMADYLLSNRYRAAVNQRLLTEYGALVAEADRENILTLLQVQESYLNASLQAIDEQYGDSKTFLHRALGIGPAERARLNALLVER